MSGLDMHVHTTASDGVLNVEEVIKLAIDEGLRGIAITDHDTIKGLAQAEELSAIYNFIVIPGIELSTEWLDKEVHIIGYLLNYELAIVQEKLEELQNARYLRMFKMVEKLNEYGYKLDIDHIISLSGSGSIGRPHLALALLEKGYVSSVKEAFQKLIGRGCIAYVPRMKLTPFEAVQFIRKVGGVPVIAHPSLSKVEGLIYELIDYGLMGVEVFHPEHDLENEKRLLEMCNKWDLLITGGSDFHGYGREGSFNIGSKTVKVDILERLQLAKQKSENEKIKFYNKS